MSNLWLWAQLVLLCLWVVSGGKDRVVKKKPIAVTDPLRLRSLEEWINLGKEALIKSCEAAGIATRGSIVQMAKRLLKVLR